MRKKSENFNFTTNYRIDHAIAICITQILFQESYKEEKIVKLEKKGNLVGQVFNIQRFSTHDGPGIRTTVFLKGCPLTCFWCQNPESQSRQPALMFRKNACVACGRCIPVCPSGANRIVDGVLVLDRDLCGKCGACVSACPKQGRSLEGRDMTVEKVIAEVRKDYLMYSNSGGGMTVSGGDCEMQPEFTVALLETAHDEGIRTAVEITGAFPWETVKRITDHADFILYDIKQMDNEKHKEGTGVPNVLVLENAKKLAGANKKILFRLPLIPGFNDHIENIGATARFVRSLGLSPAKHLELLPYNNLGEEKYARLEFEREHPNYKRQPEDYIKELKALCASI
ncbi:MAG TPA: glycyl-radical enzyme activating protein [Peptococcaceae bacterium]|nr:glycyl-radical enzyme activating protein [Peptococcaceae bacterium]